MSTSQKCLPRRCVPENIIDLRALCYIVVCTLIRPASETWRTLFLHQELCENSQENSVLMTSHSHSCFSSIECKLPSLCLCCSWEFWGHWEVRGCLKWSESCSVVSDSIQSMEVSRPEYWSGLFSRASSQPRDRTQVSHISGRFFTIWVTREAQEYWSG